MAFFQVEKRTSNKTGAVTYKCSIRVKSKGKILYSEYRNFSKAQAANAWGRARIAEIELNGIPSQQDELPTLQGLIKFCFEDNNINTTIGRSKRYGLSLISDCNIAKLPIDQLKTKHIIEHCKLRRASGTGASTVATDISFIRWVFKTAKVNFSHEINDSCITEAYDILYSQNLISKSEKRSRRPIELEKLKVGLAERQAQRASGDIPYVEMLDFSILSCMRIGEVCKITWEDLDEENKAVIVRDRKDPRKKSGNHMLVPLIGGAFELVMKQPRKDERIFPYNSRSVTPGFQRVRAKLGIEDLRYHDLRREGASRLFEKGYAIDEVAQVTGHRAMALT
ncbi:site-specific integrase [Parashewanella spongiae]|uniref:Site-specific integrase n=1 Tax=Parashewanella spongiae TaxID=342950 RepID=A0A3A6T0Y4_9GAMM|nr:site-specific integrase [Parashewanella spongiae]MCL1080222.1 site-specific integrase [Parashewanella spongiae]RJY01909.1 site-specific integrase [Parashewanella spongiae]